MNIAEARELVMSARINLDNLAEVTVPLIKKHPMFVVVAMQLDEAAKALADGPREKETPASIEGRS